MMGSVSIRIPLEYPRETPTVSVPLYLPARAFSPLVELHSSAPAPLVPPPVPVFAANADAAGGDAAAEPVFPGTPVDTTAWVKSGVLRLDIALPPRPAPPPSDSAPPVADGAASPTGGAASPRGGSSRAGSWASPHSVGASGGGTPRSALSPRGAAPASPRSSAAASPRAAGSPRSGSVADAPAASPPPPPPQPRWDTSFPAAAPAASHHPTPARAKAAAPAPAATSPPARRRARRRKATRSCPPPRDAAAVASRAQAHMSAAAGAVASAESTGHSLAVSLTLAPGLPPVRPPAGRLTSRRMLPDYVAAHPEVLLAGARREAVRFSRLAAPVERRRLWLASPHAVVTPHPPPLPSPPPKLPPLEDAPASGRRAA